MKVKLKQENEKFNPLHLNIIIENEEELCYMWSLFNIPRNQIVKQGEDKFGNKVCYPHNLKYDIWEKIDKVVQDRGL